MYLIVSEIRIILNCKFESFTILLYYSTLITNLYNPGPKHYSELAKVKTLSGTKSLFELGREKEG